MTSCTVPAAGARRLDGSALDQRSLYIPVSYRLRMPGMYAYQQGIDRGARGATCMQRPAAYSRMNCLMNNRHDSVGGRDTTDLCSRTHRRHRAYPRLRDPGGGQIDNSGKSNECSLSVVDGRPAHVPAPNPNAGELKILADGRVIDLQPLEQMPVSLSRRQKSCCRDIGDVVAHAYPIDTATLRLIATSRALTVLMPQEPLDIPFKMWEDGRKSLEQFVQQVSAP